MGRAWWLKKHPQARIATIIGAFELCVANREVGEPGSLDTITPYDYKAGGPGGKPDSGYMGAFSWEQSKWEAGGGRGRPYEASFPEQVRVFRQNGRNGEWTLGNWPTIAGCEQYR